MLLSREMHPCRVFAASLAFTVLTVLASAQVSVTVTKPTPNYSGASPMEVSAYASSPKGMSSMAILVDGTQVFFQWGDSFTAYLWLKKGNHSVVVKGTDNTGATGTQTVPVHSTILSGTVYNIDDLANWQSCTNCTGGGQGALTYSSANQNPPSRDGASRVFTLSGTGPYSNAYWYNFVGGSKDAMNFMYDTYVMIDKPDNPQALELDVNQSFNQQRWVFGTQCNFKGGPPLGGYWNVWDGGTSQWIATSVPCKPLAANKWHHVVWVVYRTGSYVHYVSVAVNGVQHPVNIQLGNQPNWPGSDIDVSVQLDGDYNQDPYSVWIDNTKLTAW